MDTVGIENLPFGRGGADCRTADRRFSRSYWQALSMSVFRNGGQGGVHPPAHDGLMQRKSNA